MARPKLFNPAEALYQVMVVFWRKGYEATSMIDLLEATGLNKSSLYGTFGGKRKLFISAFDTYRNDRRRDMRRVLGRGHARQAIEEFFRMLFANPGTLEPARGCMSINQGVEMAPHDPEIRARVMEDFRHIEDALTRVIERGQRDGSLTSSRNGRELARLLVLAFPGLQVMARTGYGQAQLNGALDLLLSHLD